MRGLRCQTGGFGEFAGSILSTALTKSCCSIQSNQRGGSENEKCVHMTEFSRTKSTFVDLCQVQLLHHSCPSMLVDFKRHQCSAVVPSSILCQPTNSPRRSSYCPIALSKCLEVAQLTTTRTLGLSTVSYNTSIL